MVLVIVLSTNSLLDVNSLVVMAAFLTLVKNADTINLILEFRCTTKHLSSRKVKFITRKRILSSAVDLKLLSPSRTFPNECLAQKVQKHD